jgi:hypothetical protein
MPSVRMLDSALATYSYAITQFNPVAAATDVWQLAGAAGTLTKIRYVEVGGTVVAARTQTVSLIKRSAATTGATNTTPTISKADTGDANPQSVITQWTTLPAGGVGAAIATADTGTFAILIGGTNAVAQDRLFFVYEQLTEKPIVLGGAGTKEYLCINFAGVNTIATDKLDFSIWWTEQ